MAMNRRRALTFIATIGAWVLPAGRPKGQQLATAWITDGPDGCPTSCKQQMLFGMRVLNSAEHMFRSQYDRFEPFDSLLAWCATHEWAYLRDAAKDQPHVVPECQVLSKFDTDSYDIWLTHPSSGFTLHTDESAVIQVGRADSRHADGSLEFVGAPLEPRALPKVRGIRQIATVISSLFVPDLYADSMCCYSLEGCSGSCNTQCGDQYPPPACSTYCCNLGYSGCQWCCHVSADNCSQCQNEFCS
jgi:hypothetical protein